jgi:cell division septation protein DedD
MNPLLDEDDEDMERTERELTLSTGVILAIFLVLVLLCGAFFGFGYKMGSHKATPPVTAADTETAQPASDKFGGFKPAAGSPAGGNGGSSAASAAETGGDSGEAPGGAAAAESTAPAAPAHTPAPVVTSPEPTVATGSFVVQVAAVSHEEDAQLLVNALRAKGYPVSAHTESQDKFFHIQVGPYNNAKDAQTAKQRLVADGYQPIIK